MKFLRELWEALKYFFFPPRCPVCDEIVDEDYQICAACYKKIFRVDFLARPPAPLERVLRVTKYRGGSRELLRELKFDNNLNVLPALKKILDDVAEREEILRLLDGVNFAVPVPLHADRLDKRGFNQVELIFADWLMKKNIPLRNFLKRTKSTPHLYDQNKSKRQEILRGAFEAIKPVDLRGKKILIVDDIFTTGTTVSECAKVLQSLGAEKICVLAFASDFGEDLSKKKSS